MVPPSAISQSEGGRVAPSSASKGPFSITSSSLCGLPCAILLLPEEGPSCNYVKAAGNMISRE